MKTIRKVVFGTLITLPLFLAPSQSKAGDLLGGLLRGLLGGGGNGGSKGCGCQTDPPPPPAPSGGSAPIDGGTVILLMAGLGLGVKLIYEKSKQQVENNLN